MHDSVVRFGMLTCSSPRCEIWYQRVVELRESDEDTHTKMGEPNVLIDEPSLSGLWLECAKQDDAPEHFRRVRLRCQKQDLITFDTALSFVYQIKNRFAHQPEVYRKVLDTFNDYQSKAIDINETVDRVLRLYAGHPDLIQGFKTFLPQGYEIECGTRDGPNATAGIETELAFSPYNSGSTQVDSVSSQPSRGWNDEAEMVYKCADGRTLS